MSLISLNFSYNRPAELTNVANIGVNSIFNPTWALDKILDSFKDRIQGIITSSIDHAKNAAIDVVTRTGRELEVAIDNAKIAYEHSMTKTFEKAEESVRNSICKLQEMIFSLEEQIRNGILKDIDADITNWIDQLPFSDPHPRLKKISPRYLVTTEAHKTATIIFEGYFKYSADKKYTPELTIAGKKLACTGNQTHQLQFKIEDVLSKTDCDYLEGELKVYYAGWIFSKTATYKIWLGLLPKSPGKITVHYVKRTQEQVTRPVIGERIDVRAASRDKGQNFQHTIFPDSGWLIDPRTVTGPYIDEAHGNHDNPHITYLDEHRIDTAVTVDGIDGKHWGIVKYHFNYTVYKDVPKEEQRTETINIGWDESKILDKVQDEIITKITLDEFTGKHQEFAGTTFNHPFFRLESDGTNTRVVIKRPDEIMV